MKALLFTIFCIGLSPHLFCQDSLYQQGLVALEKANYVVAFEAFEASSKTYEIQGNTTAFVKVQLKMAECLDRTSKYHEALSLIDKSFDLVTLRLDSNVFLMAESYRLKGENLLNLGRNDEALALLLQAETYYPDSAQLEIAECSNLLGVIYGNNQNETLALNYHQSALDIRRKELGDGHIKVGDSYNNIGLIYLNIDALQANIYLKKAFDIYTKELGPLSPKSAFVMINLARCKALQGQYSEAEALIADVEKIWQENYGNPIHSNKAFANAVLGQIKQQEGRFEEALELQQKALKEYLELYGPKHPDVANQYQLIGKVYREKENYKAAIHAFQQAIYANLEQQTFSSDYELPQLKAYFHPDYLLSALIDKASTLEAFHFAKTLKQRDLKSAIETLQLADDLISEIRKFRVSENDKIKLGQTARQVYETGCRLAQILGEQPFQASKYNPIVFDFIERSKASVLQQAIQDTKAKSFTGIPDDLIELEDSIKTALAFYQQKVALGEDLDESKKQVFKYQTAFRDFTDQLENEYAAYYQLKYQKEVPSSKDLIASLSQEVTIIQYFLGKESLYIMTIDHKSLSVEVIPNSQDVIRNITGFKNAIKFQMTTKYHLLCNELSEQLVPKLHKGTKKLIIIPDGILSTLPFEALFKPGSREYLSESFDISYAFAASFYGNDSTNKLDGSGRINLFAPVDFAYEHEDLPRLNATLDEVNQISQLFTTRQQDAMINSGKDATETEVKSAALSGYEFLHFATHGKVNQSQPELSRLYLKGDALNDGYLYAGEIYNLNMDARLVSLSACETGLGKIEAGEGIVGLSRALLYAGADNLLVSLWTVSDEATAFMMTQFFEYHLNHKNETFSSALQYAKSSMIQSEKYNAPYFWAPFILIGE